MSVYSHFAGHVEMLGDTQWKQFERNASKNEDEWESWEMAKRKSRSVNSTCRNTATWQKQASKNEQDVKSKVKIIFMNKSRLVECADSFHFCCEIVGKDGQYQATKCDNIKKISK